jgi:hypothetical protein
MIHSKRSLYPDHTSRYFKLDEIEWENHDPVHPKLIPFENRTKKIIQELKQEKAQATNTHHH